MKFVILTGSPKHEGLAHDCVEAAVRGIREGGAEAEVIRLCDSGVARCHVCGDGWGTCRESGACKFGDDGFTAVQHALYGADAVVLATPVYYGEPSEPVKAFMDRLRRCENPRHEAGKLRGKPVLLIASPGGSGGGAVTCFLMMEKYCQHMGMPVFDMVLVNRWNRGYKLDAITAAARAMAGGKRPG